MENNSPQAHHSVSSDEALAQLQAISDSRSALADRLVTPPWYHPALAGLIFVFVAGTSSSRWSSLTFSLFSAGLAGLVLAYRRATGVWVNGWNSTGGRGSAVMLSVVLFGAVAVAVTVRAGVLPWWWAFVAAAAAAACAAWVGPRFDSSLRAALRETQ